MNESFTKFSGYILSLSEGSIYRMAGKYLKKNKQVVTFNTLTALAMLAEAGAESIENATGSQICDLLRDDL